MNTLEDKLKAAVLAAALEEEGRKSRKSALPVLKWALPALAAACIAAAIFIPGGPKDTFDSPELAYAEVERTFAYISQKIEKGSDIAARAEEPIETIKNIFK